MKLTKVYDQKMLKLQLRIAADCEQEVHAGLAEVGAQIKWGMAPQTDTIRRIQSIVDEARQS